MSIYNSLYNKKPKKIISSGNVLDLIQKAKAEQKKEKRQNIIIAAAAISALVASGFVISL